MVKRVSITLDEEQSRLIKNLKFLGKKDAEIVKNIVIAYLSEKGYIKEFNKWIK